MRTITPISYALFALLLLAGFGCELPAQREPQGGGYDGNKAPACVFYAPEKIDILPLTEFKDAAGGETRLEAYVSLLDSAGSQIKFPGKVRFELYEHVQRSAEPKGRRVAIWPEINTTEPNEPRSHWFDLGDPARNDLFWRDFIRAYQFTLPCGPQPAASYILEATCLTNDGRRLIAETSLRKIK
jgi:hypothetical protein